MRTEILMLCALMTLSACDFDDFVDTSPDEILAPGQDQPDLDECVEGDLECPCSDAGECAAGLTCDYAGLCQFCTVGAYGCECDCSGGCSAGLTCSEDMVCTH